MNLQEFVNCVAMPCCILSVEKTPEGRCGEIRIVCSNQSYKETMGPAYYDNMLYYELVPQNNMFEDYCFRAAINKQRMHAYVDVPGLNCWTDQTIIPVESDRDDIGYCQFIFEFTETREADRIDQIPFDVASVVIRSCIKLMSKDDFHKSVESVLGELMVFSDAMAGRIMLVDEEKKKAEIFCEMIRKDIWPERANAEQDVITYDLISTWDKLIGDSNVVIVKDGKDLEDLGKKNPEWAASMKEHMVESLALIPLRREKSTIGYLYIVNFDVTKMVKVKELIELVSFFLGSEISNYLFFQKLEELSNLDDLTGLKNRHAMMKTVDILNDAAGSVSYGIINLDLNGLKIINDKQGHVAGDTTLVQVADILRKEFRDEELYRIGGDEFIVLIPDIAEDVFNRRVEEFRKKVPEEYYISLAMGSYWTDGSETTHESFLRADRSMYENKKAYYARHPELKHE